MFRKHCDIQVERHIGLSFAILTSMVTVTQTDYYSNVAQILVELGPSLNSDGTPAVTEAYFKLRRKVAFKTRGYKDYEITRRIRFNYLPVRQYIDGEKTVIGKIEGIAFVELTFRFINGILYEVGEAKKFTKGGDANV